jgi:polysaccharide biosynthesis protein PslH
MKLLWVKSDYLHPTTRGGQIRTLEMLRCLHKRHEIHYVCLDDGSSSEGAARSSEYCSKAYAIPHSVPEHRSLRFAAQVAAGLTQTLPVAVSRFRSAAMKRQIAALLQSQKFDCVVCDFLFPAPNIPNIADAVLFQHNVEAVIWKRRAMHASNAVNRAYLKLQARRMERYEREICRSARHVVAVSQADRQIFEHDYGAASVSAISTGVDLNHFNHVAPAPKRSDLVFIGSMDWLPNVDGARFFIERIYPRIRQQFPDCKVAFVGRRPDPALKQAAAAYSNLIVTGTVDDVRPWLWGSAISIVPLRIGGGTRLKIFEAMAARVPVVSTTIGAEGLPLDRGRHLLIEDDPRSFADACVTLLREAARRDQLADAAWNLVAEDYSWEAVTRDFEAILDKYSLPGTAAELVAVR